MSAQSLERRGKKNFSEPKAEPKKVGNKSPDIDPGLLPSTAPYIPGILLDAIASHPDRNPPWVDSIEGTLLLADISGFTPMTEKLAEVGKEGAELLTNIINQYFQSMLDTSNQYGGDNLKFGGDALLILFQGESHALRAVAAALAMQRTTGQFKAFRAGSFRLRLKMTIGVHSGNFYSAAAGLAGHTMQHFILGPDTNRVCELQDEAESGELLISESSMKQLGEFCITEPRGGNYLVRRLRVKPIIQSLINKPDAGLPAGVTEIVAFLPPPIAQGLRSDGKVRNIEGEHRKVTIIFINLIGINKLLEEYGAESMLKELQQYLTALLQLSNESGGFLAGNDVYTHGLKLILVFGAPVAHEYDSASALHLVTELSRKLAELKLHLSYKIGVNSGFVFAGDVGPAYRRQYTVMGDAVNLSARLMSACSADKALVSRQVIIEAGASFQSRELAPIQVKGKRDAIPVYELEGERNVAPAILSEPASTLFGREKELALFKKTCRKIGSGKGQVVIVSGEAGIGKSRLIQSFQDHTNSLGWETYTGTCQSHTVSKPFTPWVGILNTFFGLSPDESAESRSQKVLSTIERLSPEFIESASLLNWLLGLSIPESDVVRSLDDESRRRRLFELVARLFQESALKLPLLILVEDLHWADHSSLELINYLGANISNSHIMVCLSQRPAKEEKIKLPERSAVTITLGELPQEVAKQFALSVLGHPNLPEQVMETILTKARGNPLFLEEIAVSLSAAGVIDKILTASTLESSKIMASLDIPDRLQTLIMARIDTLGNFLKEVIRTASVIGSTFDIPTLQPLLSFSAEEVNLEHCLQDLSQLDLLAPYPDIKQDMYRFKSTLIQDIAYDSLLFARRRELHQQVATCIEEANGGKLETVYEILVHHYSHGRNNDKTLTYAVKAADKARKVFAHEEAIDYYRRALDSVKQIGGAIVHQGNYIIERIGDCYEDGGQHAEAAKAYSEALRAWRQARRYGTPPPLSDLLGIPPARVRESALCRKIGVSYERHFEYDSSLRWLDTALSKLPPRQPSQAALIWTAMTLTLFRKGLHEESIRCGRVGLTLSRRSSDLRHLAYAHTILAGSYLWTGKVKQALRHRLIAVRLYEEVGDIFGQSVAHSNVGGCYQALGILDKALYHYQAGLEACQRLGNPNLVAIKHNNIAEVLLIQGHIEEAIDHLDKVVETYERTGSPLGPTGLAMINLSRAYQRQQDYPKAFRQLQKAMELIKKARHPGLQAEALLQQAELELETGQIELARRTCQRGLKETGKMGLKLVEVRGLRILGRINMARADGYVQAEANLQQSVLLAEQMKADYEKALSLLYLAELRSSERVGKENRRGFRTAISQAIAIFRRIGAQKDLDRAVKLGTSYP
ncbi:MAG: adenylate/guanylate cyclase domain-containing protein [Dehalococcoidales bacterium]|nr:adenylate/guanylate cyclase domain-containing protein [Dehalococcoidales bacterium]